MFKAASVTVGAMFILGVLAATVVLHESAGVVLAIPAQRVEAQLTMTGGPAEGDLPTQPLSVQFTDTLAGAASPATVGSTYATGEVVFTFYSACTRECGGISIRVPPGSDVYTNTNVHYITLADEWFQTTSKPTPVRAVLPGTAGNTSPGTIVNFGYNVVPGLVVTNPRPVGGGADRQTHVVSQSDFDGVAREAAAEAIAGARDRAWHRAAGMGLAFIGRPALEIATSHKVGAETLTFTVSVTASLQAVTFFDRAARGRLVYAVLAKIRPDHQLTKDAIETDYQVDAVSADGEVKITGTAVAFVMPKVQAQALQNRIAGLDVARARDVLTQAVPGASVRIQVWPAWMAWLPAIPDNIAITVESLPAPA